MSSRKTDKPIIKTENQLALPTVETANRFQTLGRIPQPYTYSSALVSDPIDQHKPLVTNPTQMDPFASDYITTIPATRSITQYQTPTYLAYIEKPTPQHKLSFIEPSLKHLKEPAQIAKAYYPPGWHFAPEHPQKTLAYYKEILVQQGSVHFKPIRDKNDPAKIIYHSLYIHGVLTLKQWGPTGSEKILKGKEFENTYRTYNYFDYMNAWFKVFLYQNEKFTHSWFITWDHKVPLNFPVWFIRWWAYYGAIPEIIPTELLDHVAIFKSQFKVSQNLSDFSELFLFMAKYKVPWIFKWQYCKTDNLIMRQHFVKWWASFDHHKTIGFVQKEFPVRIPTPVNTAKLMTQAGPSQASPTQLLNPSQVGTTQPARPSSSKTAKPKSKSKASSGSGTEQLLQMAQLLMAQAQMAQAQPEDEDTEDDNNSEGDSNESISNYYHQAQFQDAQDPFA